MDKIERDVARLKEACGLRTLTNSGLLGSHETPDGPNGDVTRWVLWYDGLAGRVFLRCDIRLDPSRKAGGPYGPKGATLWKEVTVPTDQVPETGLREYLDGLENLVLEALLFAQAESASAWRIRRTTTRRGRNG